jgi:hypothetical protein
MMRIVGHRRALTRKLAVSTLLAVNALLAYVWVRGYFVLDGLWLHRSHSEVRLHSTRGHIEVMVSDWSGATLKEQEQPSGAEHYTMPPRDISKKHPFGRFALRWDRPVSVHPMDGTTYYGPRFVEVVVPYWFLVLLTAAWPISLWVRRLTRSRRGFPLAQGGTTGSGTELLRTTKANETGTERNEDAGTEPNGDAGRS